MWRIIRLIDNFVNNRPIFFSQVRKKSKFEKQKFTPYSCYLLRLIHEPQKRPM